MVKKRKVGVPEHPGKLIADYLTKNEITQTEFARQLGCAHAKVNEVINGKRSVSPDFALDLERVTKTEAKDWVINQALYDLWKAQEKRKEQE